jgi:hypothetical protein
VKKTPATPARPLQARHPGQQPLRCAPPPSQSARLAWRTELADLDGTTELVETEIIRRRIGDLISYQNDGKARTVITGKAERA